MKEIAIKQYKYEPIEIESKKFILPEDEQYFFQTGIRRAIRITPNWTTWKKEEGEEEEIFEYNVVFVYNSFETKIEVVSFLVSQIEQIYYSSKDVYDFVRYWVDEELNKRTKEQFDADLDMALGKINRKN